MYNHNRHSGTYLYSDYMIYSPGVLVFRDDDCKLINNPYQERRSLNLAYGQQTLGFELEPESFNTIIINP
ncbi:hypothetical protein D3C78_1856270 [compost metagenome]